jgi:hypothetical protein
VGGWVLTVDSGSGTLLQEVPESPSPSRGSGGGVSPPELPATRGAASTYDVATHHPSSPSDVGGDWAWSDEANDKAEVSVMMQRTPASPCAAQGGAHTPGAEEQDAPSAAWYQAKSKPSHKAPVTAGNAAAREKLLSAMHRAGQYTPLRPGQSPLDSSPISKPKSEKSGNTRTKC